MYCGQCGQWVDQVLVHQYQGHNVWGQNYCTTHGRRRGECAYLHPPPEPLKPPPIVKALFGDTGCLFLVLLAVFTIAVLVHLL